MYMYNLFFRGGEKEVAVGREIEQKTEGGVLLQEADGAAGDRHPRRTALFSVTET
jgi:hypothetical protein